MHIYEPATDAALYPETRAAVHSLFGLPVQWVWMNGAQRRPRHAVDKAQGEIQMADR